MKRVICRRDGQRCDLNKDRRSCRFIDGTWNGKCYDQLIAEARTEEK